jgi:fimbrial chaperone protein
MKKCFVFIAAKISTFLLLFFLTSSGITHAATFNVLPVRIYMEAGRPIASIKVENKEQKSVVIQSETVVWAQQDNNQLLTPTNELIVSPAIFELAPNGTQVVRVALRSKVPVTSQRTFRLFLSEVPALDEEKAVASGVKVALRLSLPIFVTPAESEPAFEWRIARRCDDPQKHDLLVENVGSQHAMMLKMNLRDEANQIAVEEIYHPRYVLPSSRATWPVTTQLEKLPQPLWLDYETLKGEKASARVNWDEGACWQKFQPPTEEIASQPVK